MVQNISLKVVPVAAAFDNAESGHPGVRILFSDDETRWFDARGRREYEEREDVPREQRIDNLPTIKSYLAAQEETSRGD